MKKTMFLILFCLISNFLSSQNVVKLKLPDNCKSTITGVKNFADKTSSKIELTPNPSSGLIRVNVLLNSRIDKAVLNVYNSRGETVFNENVFSNTNNLIKDFNLTGLQPGIYIFSIKNIREVLSTKLVINNK